MGRNGDCKSYHLFLSSPLTTYMFETKANKKIVLVCAPNDENWVLVLGLMRFV